VRKRRAPPRSDAAFVGGGKARRRLAVEQLAYLVAVEKKIKR
jgi:hypothetical protein